MASGEAGNGDSGSKARRKKEYEVIAAKPHEVQPRRPRSTCTVCRGTAVDVRTTIHDPAGQKIEYWREAYHVGVEKDKFRVRWNRRDRGEADKDECFRSKNVRPSFYWSGYRWIARPPLASRRALEAFDFHQTTAETDTQ